MRRGSTTPTGLGPLPRKINVSLKMTCFLAFWEAFLSVSSLEKMLNFAPEVVIWWTYSGNNVQITAIGQYLLQCAVWLAGRCRCPRVRWSPCSAVERTPWPRWTSQAPVRRRTPDAARSARPRPTTASATECPVYDRRSSGACVDRTAVCTASCRRSGLTASCSSPHTFAPTHIQWRAHAGIMGTQGRI